MGPSVSPSSDSESEESHTLDLSHEGDDRSSSPHAIAPLLSTYISDDTESFGHHGPHEDDGDDGRPFVRSPAAGQHAHSNEGGDTVDQNENQLQVGFPEIKEGATMQDLVNGLNSMRTTLNGVVTELRQTKGHLQETNDKLERTKAGLRETNAQLEGLAITFLDVTLSLGVQGIDTEKRLQLVSEMLLKWITFSTSDPYSVKLRIVLS